MGSLSALKGDIGQEISVKLGKAFIKYMESDQIDELVEEQGYKFVEEVIKSVFNDKKLKNAVKTKVLQMVSTKDIVGKLAEATVKRIGANA
jgi:hypothetical protein